FSATLSVEDPVFRRTPIFGTGTAGAASQFQVFGAGSGNFTPVIAVNAAGVPVGVANYDAIQRSRMPDFVGALRYDAAWGSAQISAAVHELNTGNASSFTPFPGFPASIPGGVTAPRPTTEYGWAVQGGVKVNLPFIAAGDALYLQGSYGVGAQLYTGYSTYNGSYTSSGNVAPGSSFSNWYSDAVIDPFTGKLDLSSSWTVVGSYLHYWAPEWRSAFIGSYGEQSFGKGSRAGVGLVSGLVGASLILSPTASQFAFSNVLRDTNQIVAGASLIWSPVRDLDIGVEGLYARQALSNGRVVDQNKNPVTPTGVVNGVPTFGGVPLATVNATDSFQVRMRVQRDF
ncbi:porin, partial [Methylobacterium crusticola]